MYFIRFILKYSGLRSQLFIQMQVEWSMSYSFLLDRGCPCAVGIPAKNLDMQPYKDQ